MRAGLLPILLKSKAVIPTVGLAAYCDLYDPTSAVQTVTDLSGNSAAMQRGSSSGADSNDPAWGGGGAGLVCTTDDHLINGSTVQALNTNWAVFLVAVCSGDSGYLFALENISSQGVRYEGSGSVAIRQYAAPTGSSSSALVVPTDAPVCLCLSCASGTMTLTRVDTASSVGKASDVSADSAHFAVGSRYLDSYAKALTAYSVLRYTRALSAKEQRDIRSVLKTQWASRGVTVL